MHEFDLIDRYFRPLAAGFSGALSLTDDAALVDVPAGMQLVVTMDTMSEGVHFLGSEEPTLIARKLLRTNLSDLAAMGAAPHCYFLSLSFPRKRESSLPVHEWVSSFASGLAQDQQLFGIHLAGGDTTSSRGSITLSITALGLVPEGKALRRNGAKPGDSIYVSGTLGDSALGLAILSPRRGETERGAPNDRSFINAPLLTSPLRGEEYLISRYLLPQPRLELGMKLRGIATSCMDISDGLVQDLGHICKASGIGAVIEAASIPLSEAARNYVIPAKAGTQLKSTNWIPAFAGMTSPLTAALTGGDDYELLFTTSEDISTLSLPCMVTKIGEITKSGGVVVLGQDGSEMILDKKGYEHF